jgi:hypothetical protein
MWRTTQAKPYLSVCTQRGGVKRPRRVAHRRVSPIRHAPLRRDTRRRAPSRRDTRRLLCLVSPPRLRVHIPLNDPIRDLRPGAYTRSPQSST